MNREDAIKVLQVRARLAGWSEVDIHWWTGWASRGSSNVDAFRARVEKSAKGRIIMAPRRV